MSHQGCEDHSDLGMKPSAHLDLCPCAKVPSRGCELEGEPDGGFVGSHVGEETQAHRQMHRRSAAESVLETKAMHRGWDLCLGTLSWQGGLTSGEQLWRLPELHLPSRPQTKYRQVLAFSTACNLPFSHLKVKVNAFVSVSLPPHGLYPPGSSVLGILQARI